MYREAVRRSRTGTPLRRILLLGGLAGLRRSEIACAHARDVSDMTIRVRGKGGRVRVVPLHPALRDELAGATGWLVPNGHGNHLTPNHINTLVVQATGYTTHSLRHRAATAWFRGSHDLLAVQRLLGHASVATTQRYVAIDVESLRSVVGAA